MAFVDSDRRLIKDGFSKVLKCAGDTTAVEELLEQLIDLVQELVDKPQEEGLSPIPYCEDGSITGFVAYIIDEETDVVTPIYFDSNFQVTDIAPTGEPCAAKPDIEFKWFIEEKCLPDGSKVKQVLCIPYLDLEEQPSSTFWIVDGVKVDVDPGVSECVEECEPSVSEAFGDNFVSLNEAHNFSITKPACCEVLITTSVGSIRLIEGVTSYSTSEFKCTITIDNVEVISGDCNTSDVHIISNKVK